MNSLINKNLEIDNFTLINFINLNSLELEMVRRWRNSETIRKWMYNEHIISEEEHKKFINSLKNSKDKVYWLVKKEDLPIGTLSFVNINWYHRRAYFGMYANPEKYSKGIGRNLLFLAIHVGFKLLNFHTLKLEVIEDNNTAISLYRKFSFKEEGRLKDFVYKNGKWKDVIIMGMVNPTEQKKQCK